MAKPTEKELRILHLEDLSTDAELVQYELRKAGIAFVAKRVAGKEEFLQALRDFAPDIILGDYSLPSYDGVSALAEAQQHCPDVPFIFVSGNIGEDEASEMVRLGATDYVLKNRLSRLVPSLERALQEAQERAKRRRAEKALQQTTELLTRVFSNIHVLIAYMDTEFNFIRVNDAYAQADGREPDFFIGKRHFALYPNDEDKTIFQKVAQTGQPSFVQEKPLEYADHPERGVTYWDWSLVPVKEPDGKVSGLVLSLVNATERRRAADAVHQKVKDLAALNDASQVFLDLIDETTTIENLCRLAVKHFGLKMAWVGLIRKGDHRVHPAWAYGFEEGYLKSVDVTWDETPTGQGPTGTAIRTAKAVAMNHVESDPRFAPWRSAALERGYRSCAALPLCYGDDVLGALNVYSEDPEYFTADRVQVLQSFANQGAIALAKARLHAQVQRDAAELERKVAERTEELQEINSELESFSYSVSHDLRAPLWAMQGFAHALLEDCADKLDETGKDYARRIVEAAKRMDAMVQDVLAYSRLSRVELAPEAVSLESAVAEAQEQVGAELQSRNAQVSVKKPLPRVMGHRTTLVQVVGNLLTNAAKFVKLGVSPRIRVWAEDNGDFARLVVADNGIGIAKENLERIFRIFDRLHRPDEYPGTGVGLAIVRRAVTRMGGHVGVESEVGKGSKFWVELKKAGDVKREA